MLEASPSRFPRPSLSLLCEKGLVQGAEVLGPHYHLNVRPWESHETQRGPGCGLTYFEI